MDIEKCIRKASNTWTSHRQACDEVAKAAQKHIDWTDEINCLFRYEDGLCLEIESNVCPADIFFEKALRKNKISFEDCKDICI